MAHRHEMKAGEVYVCTSSGLEVQVAESCVDTGSCACRHAVMRGRAPLERTE